MSQNKSRLGCAEFRRNVRLSRRGFLQAGALGIGGLSLADLFRLEAQGAPIHQDRSVIILWMRGGPSQHETWDPKPEAPSATNAAARPSGMVRGLCRSARAP